MKVQNVKQFSGINFPLLILLGLLTALDAIAIDMYLPGMPNIAENFGVDPGHVQQTLSVFLAGLAIGQGIYGPLLDRYGRRLPLLIGIIIFAAGSAISALAPSIEFLLAARFLQALGASAGLVTPRAVVADLCDVKESARIFSILMQIMMIAPIVAPVLGGYLLAYGSWRTIFWVLTVLGVVGFFWSLSSVPDSLAMERRASLHPSNIVRSYMAQLGNFEFMAYTLSGGFSLGGLFVYISGSAFTFTNHFGLTPTEFSYVFAMNSLGLVLGGILANKLLSSGVTIKLILLIGLFVHVISAFVLYLLTRFCENISLMSYTVFLAVSIAALGFVFGSLTALSMSKAGAQVGIASALMGMLQYLVSAIVGYVVSFISQEPSQLPLVIGVCGSISIFLYFLVNNKVYKERRYGVVPK